MCIFSKLSQTVLLPIGTKGALLRCESQGLPTLVEKIYAMDVQDNLVTLWRYRNWKYGDLATDVVCFANNNIN